MSTFVDGIGASQHLDTAGEIISIEGMDITSLARAGILNWEHLKDSPGQVVGKVLKAKKIFSEKDCADERELYFWKKCQIPYIYVMGELFDDYKDSAKEVAGLFRYDADKEGQQEVDVVGFSIEGQYLHKEGAVVTRSIARKCTITTANANKMALAKMVPAKRKADDIDSIFKTELGGAEIYEPLEKDLKTTKPTKPSLSIAPAPNPLGQKLGMVGSHELFSHAKPANYPKANVSELRQMRDAHFAAAQKVKGNPKLGQHHSLMSQRFEQVAGRLESRQSASAAALAPKLGLNSTPAAPAKPSGASVAPTTSAPTAKPKQGPSTNKLFDPRLSGTAKAPTIAKPPMNATPAKPAMHKSLEAGSGMAAPSQLTQGAALGKEDLVKPKIHMAPVIKPQGVKPSAPGAKHGTVKFSSSLKKKGKWLARAEDEYSKWERRTQFEVFMAKRMPHLTKSEVKAIGQAMALNKSISLEKALSSISGLSKSQRITSADPMNKAAGKDSIFTLILFDGCELHDILHCSHFATDDVSSLDAIKAECDKYFKEHEKSPELSFKDEGTLGKEEQKVLFLTEGDPLKELHEKLAKVAKYKYASFRPHISVTSNVDEFKGKASSLVISVNGEVKHKYSLK